MGRLDRLEDFECLPKGRAEAVTRFDAAAKIQVERLLEDNGPADVQVGVVVGVEAVPMAVDSALLAVGGYRAGHA